MTHTLRLQCIYVDSRFQRNLLRTHEQGERNAALQYTYARVV